MLDMSSEIEDDTESISSDVCQGLGVGRGQTLFTSPQSARGRVRGMYRRGISSRLLH